MRAWRFSKVQHNPVIAELIGARVVGWAAMGDPIERGPGLSQSDAVQYVSDLAILRHICAVGVLRCKFAEYNTNGAFLGVKWISLRDWTPSAESTLIPIVGDEPIEHPSEWSGKLTLAIDEVLRRIAKAEQAGEIQSGWGSEYPGGAVPIPGGIGAGVVAIIVAGAAVAVVGSFAAWRYFDPQLRMHAAAVRTAAKAYESRLRTMVETNNWAIPAGPLETVNQQWVDESHKPARNRAWLYGGCALGGIAAGVGGTAYIRSAVGG